MGYYEKQNFTTFRTEENFLMIHNIEEYFKQDAKTNKQTKIEENFIQLL